MKKVLMFLCLMTILCGCEADKMKIKTCSYTNKEAMSNVSVNAYYTSEDVPKIVVEMSQRYEDDVVKNMGQEKIETMVRNSLSTTAGNDVQMDVEYDAKKQEIHVNMILFTEEMEEKELASFNLDESKTIAKFVERMESLNYTCKDVSQ